MPVREPAWWYGPARGAAARLLGPAGRLYGWVAVQRFRAAVPAAPALPVICIGNFTAGGTGKTPLALMVAGRLRQQGEHPAFLSRGYGGRLAGPHWVDPGRDLATAVGDEPLLLARAFPTLIARDRAEGAAAIADGRPRDAEATRPSVVVMDDGLQNASLIKTLTLAVVDGGRGFGNGRVIPAGPLRAPLAHQLGLADAIVINHGAAAPAECPVADRLRQSFKGPILGACVRPAGDLGWLRGTRVTAFAGIANPDRFFHLLDQLGARLVETRAFPDHHQLSDAEAAALLTSAKRSGAQLVTTEKDQVRLAGATGAAGELAHRAQTVGIEMTLGQRDLGQLDTLVRLALGSHAAAYRNSDDYTVAT